MHKALAPYATQKVTLLTLTTLGNQPVLTGAVAHMWSDLLANAGGRRNWHLLGHVTLPEHTHLVVARADRLTLDQIVRGVTGMSERAVGELLGMPSPEPVWQRAYRRQPAQAPDDMADFLDYVHYNPVRHRAADRPEEWPHSSYGRWVEQGLYKLGWGWTEPESIRGKNWE